MAGGFSFPPPPPPPPKPAAPNQQPDIDYTQQPSYQSHGRGGNEPRGRGVGRGRGGGGGRGRPSFEPASRGQHSNLNNGRGSLHSNITRNDQSPWQQQSPGVFHTSSNPRPPPGSYVNPNFSGPRPKVNENPERQHASLPDSQSKAFGGGPIPQQSSSHTQYAQNNGPGRSQAGHKRKLDALRGPQQPREKKPGPQTVPSVPSFGAPILPQSATSNQQSVSTKPADSGNKSATGSRTLGLTPSNGMPPAYPSDSEDEDVDEEAQFAELGTKLTFEHNGEVMTLNNEADLAAWKEERKKQFPTNNRISQKESERLRVGEERKRLLAAVAKLHQAPRSRHVQTKTRSLRDAQDAGEGQSRQSCPGTSAPESNSHFAGNAHVGIQPVQEVQDTATLANEEPTAEGPAEVEKAGPDATTHADMDIGPTAATEEQAEAPKRLPGIDMDESEDESTAEATGVKPASESEEDEDSSSDSDSEDNGPPEQTSSKPPPSAAFDAQRPVCRYFAASGRCRDGDACRFRHELSSKAPSARPAQPKEARPAFDRYAPKLDPKPNDRKSIFERLVEQEQEGDDKLALQVIKALGHARFFAEAEANGDA